MGERERKNKGEQKHKGKRQSTNSNNTKYVRFIREIGNPVNKRKL